MQTFLPSLNTGSSILDDYVRKVARIHQDAPPVPELVAEVARANEVFRSTPGFRLPEPFRRSCEGACYTRNLVYQDPKKRFTVIALVWGPFQETRVHDHLNWCVVSVLEGRCHTVEYDRLDDESAPARAELAIRGSRVCPAGTTMSLLPPRRSNIHRMSNGARGTAVSLHTYGDPGTKARVFDPALGTVEIVDLEFHNLGP